MSRQLDLKKFDVPKVSVNYPNFYINAISNASVVVFQLLDEGEVPLIVEHKGERRIVKRISLSAYNMSRLLRIHDKVCFCVSEENTVEVTDVETYMEVIANWM